MILFYNYEYKKGPETSFAVVMVLHCTVFAWFSLDHPSLSLSISLSNEKWGSEERFTKRQNYANLSFFLSKAQQFPAQLMARAVENKLGFCFKREREREREERKRERSCLLHKEEKGENNFLSSLG